jgi:hypothetical protein
MIEISIRPVENSGTQVFRGESEGEVIQKLAEAQYHATKKIRELNYELKRARAVLRLLRRKRTVTPVRTAPLTPKQ